MLELSLEAAMASIELMAEPAAIIGDVGDVLATNTAWDGFSGENGGITERTGVGANYLDVCDRAAGEHTAGAAEIAAGIRGVLSGRLARFQLDYPCPRADGTERWYRVHVRRLAADPALVISHHEILQEADLRATEDVSRFITEGNRTVPLISGIAHEVRTPLAAIMGFASSLRTYWAQLDEGRRLAYLDRIEANGIRLEEVLDEFLLIAQLKAGVAAPTRGPTDVSSSIAAALVEMDPDIVHYEQRKVVARVDPGHLRLMMRNLLSNATKYGQAPVSIDVSEREDVVEIVVRDHGDGIPEDLRDRLFEPFARGRADAASDTPGSGLGLSIVRDLVRLNSGEIAYEDANPGARFTLRLPAA